MRPWWIVGIMSAPLMLLPAFGQTSPNAIVTPLPGSPLQIVSVTPAGIKAPASIPAEVAARLTGWRITLANTGSVPVVAYTIRSGWAGDDGQPPSGRNNCLTRASDPKRPVLAAGRTMSISSQLLRRPVGRTLYEALDMVLLADGSFYGRNLCRTLQQLQTSLTAKRSTEQWILNLLETQGPEAAKEALRQDLSAPEKDQAVLLVKQKH